MFRLILFVLLLLMPMPAAFAQGILVIGDSISSAYGMPVEHGWVALLKKRLQSEQLPYEVINLSISGNTSANALDRLPQALEKHQPTILMLEIGGNDGLRGLSLAQMQQNLEEMIDLSTGKHVRVLLLGIQLPPNYGPTYTTRFNEVYRQLADQHELVLLPSMIEGIGDKPEYMQVDGIHPNSRAQPLILELVWPKLLKLIVDK